MSNDERLAAILDKSELEILRSLEGLSLPDLHRVEQLEIDGKNRDKVLDAIDDTLSALSKHA